MAFDPMEYIWEKLPKQRGADGIEFIEYTVVDLGYLYNNGFVDAQTYTLDEWFTVFIPFQTGKNAFRLTKEQFLPLRKYRYEGMIRIPFDPMKIREGDWTEENLWKLYHLSIKPSSTLTERQFGLMLDGAKKKGVLKDGIFKLDRSFKVRLQQLIGQNPSPLRRLETRVSLAKEEVVEKAAKAQESGFKEGKTKAQETSQAFADLLSRK